MLKNTLIYKICLVFLFFPISVFSKDRDLVRVFADIPFVELSQEISLPTPNNHIYDVGMEGFYAKTRTNDEYGLPGWIRNDGNRFHKGVDIIPIKFEKTKKTVTIDYYDPKTKKDFSVDEPVLIPKDEIYSILDGIVVVINSVEGKSGYGRYIMIEHHFSDGSPFISMYAHLDRFTVKEGDRVKGGSQIGWMGQTSSNPTGRDYLKAIPHCHFEIGRVINPNFAKYYSSKMYPTIIGGKYDPSNIQPFNPIKFLLKYHLEQTIIKMNYFRFDNLYKPVYSIYR